MLVAESILEKVGPLLIRDVQASQKEKGIIASGRSAGSLSFTVERKGTTVIFELSGAHYWYYQQNGRGPNRKQGRPSTEFVNIIRNWIQVKRLSIPLSAAGAIATKIVREGYTVPNRFNPGGVLSEPLKSTRVKELIEGDLVAGYKVAIRSELF